MNVADPSPKEQAERLRRKNALLELMEEIARASNEAEELEDALQVAVDRICEYTGWPEGHVYVREESPLGDRHGVGRGFAPEGDRESTNGESPGDSIHLKPTPIWNRGSRGRFETFRDVTEDTTFREGDGLPGRVAKRGEAAWIEDVTEDPAFPRTECAADLGVKGAFAFPIFLKEGVIEGGKTDRKLVAVLEFLSGKTEPPNQEFLDAMASIGTQLGRVAERVRARRRMEASQKRYQFLAETAVDAIVVADESGRILDWNRGAEDIFGYGEEEALGRPIQILMPARYEEAHREGMERVRRTGEGRYLGETIRMEGIRKSGEEFPLELSLSSWEAGEHRYFAAIIRDVTERHRLQREVLQVQEEERRRLGQDLHDGLAAQLTGAILKLGLFARKHGDQMPDDLEEVQEIIEECTDEVRRLSRGLRPSGLPEGDLPSALQELVENIEEARFDGAPDSLSIGIGEEEATHLYRIAQEAVNNARRHGEAEAVEIRLRKTTEALLLAVEDAGTGFRSDEVSEGLGLRSMQHRAELLGADLQMESQPGEGTFVQCRLPL